MPVSYKWRGSFENPEVNALHAEAFETRVYSDEEWNWNNFLAKHSFGWVVARDGNRLVGLVNVLWDGFAHAWIQDTMVAKGDRSRGIGTQMIEIVRSECRRAGCEWLHVDFDEDLGKFYFQILWLHANYGWAHSTQLSERPRRGCPHSMPVMRPGDGDG
jgi:GNAT superfamily N-acetyltransferase